MKTFTIVGCGARGRIYSELLAGLGWQLRALADPIECRRNVVQSYFKEDASHFNDAEALLEQGKIADLIIISVQDVDHYKLCMQALDLGYDILLEKPAATRSEEVLNLKRKAATAPGRIIICHVTYCKHVGKKQE